MIFELWEFGEPYLYGLKIVFGSFCIVIDLVVRVLIDWKSYSWRTFDEDNVGIVVPGELILMGGEGISSLVENMGSELLYES